MFLTITSPAWLGSIVGFLASPEMIALWRDPVSYVRKGGSAGLDSIAPDHPVWVKFARAMVPFMHRAGMPTRLGSSSRLAGLLGSRGTWRRLDRSMRVCSRPSHV